jgi:hypothetical protein
MTLLNVEPLSEVLAVIKGDAQVNDNAVTASVEQEMP